MRRKKRPTAKPTIQNNASGIIKIEDKNNVFFCRKRKQWNEWHEWGQKVKRRFCEKKEKREHKTTAPSTMSSSWTKKSREKKENGWAEKKKRTKKNEREKPNPAEVKINRNERNHVRLKGIFIYSISRIYYFRTRSLRLCPWNNGILHLKQFNVLENICVRIFIHTLTHTNTTEYIHICTMKSNRAHNFMTNSKMIGH